MNKPPIRAAGDAVLWQSFQMGSVKAVYLARLVILAILLTPADFGLFAIATAASGLLQNLTNFAMVPALVQAQDLDEAKYAAAWTFDMARSLLVTVVTIIAAPFIASIFAEPMALHLIQAMAIRPLLESMVSIKVAALNRNLTFRPLAFIKIVEAVINAIVSVSLARSYGVWAMVFGMLIGGMAMVIASYLLAPYRPRVLFDWKSVRPLMKFGGWILLTGVISMVGHFGLRIVISRQVGAEGLGLYFLAAQLAFLPSEVASEVVGAVSFPLYSRLQSELHQAARAFQAILTSLMALLYPVSALIIVMSPILVTEVLGSKWDGTVPLIQILALVTMIALLGDATIPLVKGFGQTYRVTQIEFVQSSLLIALIWFFTGKYGVVGAALAWLPAIIGVQILCVYFIQDIFHDPLRETRRPLLAILLATAAGMGISYLAISLSPNILGLLLAAALAVFLTGSILWFLDQRYSLGLVRNLVIAFPQVASIFKMRDTKIG